MPVRTRIYYESLSLIVLNILRRKREDGLHNEIVSRHALTDSTYNIYVWITKRAR